MAMLSPLFDRLISRHGGATASSTLVPPGLGCPPACAASGASSPAEAEASSSYVAGDGVWDRLRHAWAPAVVVALACRHFNLAISLGGWSSCFTLRRATETRVELSSKPPAHPRRPPIPTSTPPPTTSRRLNRRPSREANSVTGHPLSRTAGRPRRRHQHHVGNIRNKGPLAQRSRRTTSPGWSPESRCPSTGAVLGHLHGLPGRLRRRRHQVASSRRRRPMANLRVLCLQVLTVAGERASPVEDELRQPGFLVAVDAERPGTVIVNGATSLWSA
jgi:hypothetical protein